MTQEEKQLLLQDICMRLPHGVNVYCEWNYLDGEKENDSGILLDIDLLKDTILFKRSSGKCTRIPFNRIDGVVKPYLRSMSSMTEIEYLQLDNIMNKRFGEALDLDISGRFENNDNQKEVKVIEVLGCSEAIDYLNSIHIDYRGLIPKGLAIEAPEGMYKLNQ